MGTVAATTSVRDSPCGEPVAEKASARRDIRTALVLTLAVWLCALATVPFVGVAMNDDASYAHSARVFAEEGRIAYNGWGSLILIPQIIYGSVLIKLFGFSYLALDMSGIFLGGVCAALMYVLARACGLGRPVACLASGILVLNPVSIALMPSFMTEFPSLALQLCSLLALVRAVRGAREGGRIDGGFLAVSVLLGMAAGSNRQPCWAASLGALIAVYLHCPKDRRRVALAATTLAAFAAAVTLWHAQQPFAAAPPWSRLAQEIVQRPMRPLMNAYELINLGALLALPLILLLRRPERANSAAILAVLTACVVLGALPVDHKYWGDPQEYLTITHSGPRLVDGQWRDAPALELAVRFLVRTFGAFVLGYALYLVAGWLREHRSLRSGEDALPAWILLWSTAVQMAVLLPWFSLNYVFDRYLIGLLPGPLIVLGLCAQAGFGSHWWARRLRLAGGALAALALVSVAFGWEYMRYTQARTDAYRSLTSVGVPRTRISGGIDMDNDTQLALGGQLHSPLVKDQVNAVFIRPAFFVSETPTIEWAETDVVRRVPYPTVLPPFRRDMYVLKTRSRHAERSR